MKLSARVVMHALACLAFPLLWSWGYELWTHSVRPAVARGSDLALATLLVFYVFVAMNVVMAIIPRTVVRYGLAAVLAVLVALYLVAHHPLRGTFLVLLSAGLSCGAIALSVPLGSFLQRFADRRRSRT